MAAVLHLNHFLVLEVDQYLFLEKMFSEAIVD